MKLDLIFFSMSCKTPGRPSELISTPCWIDTPSLLSQWYVSFLIHVGQRSPNCSKVAAGRSSFFLHNPGGVPLARRNMFLQKLMITFVQLEKVWTFTTKTSFHCSRFTTEPVTVALYRWLVFNSCSTATPMTLPVELNLLLSDGQPTFTTGTSYWSYKP